MDSAAARVRWFLKFYDHFQEIFIYNSVYIILVACVVSYGPYNVSRECSSLHQKPINLASLIKLLVTQGKINFKLRHGNSLNWTLHDCR